MVNPQVDQNGNPLAPDIGAPPGKQVFVSEVDVRVINGNFIPCRTCHWYSVCAVPQGNSLPAQKMYLGSNDIHYNNTETMAFAGNTIFHCLEYTVVGDKK